VIIVIIRIMIVYIAYPTSLTLGSANALQTFTTLRELCARRPDTLAMIPRWGREASRFTEVGALHLPRPAIGKLSRLHRSTLLYYLEHSAFAAMTAAIVARQRQRVEAVYVRQVVCAAWWAGVYGPRLGIPVIYEAHDLESRNPSRAKEPWAVGLLHLLDKVAITRSSAVASLTEAFKALLCEMNWRGNSEIAVIPDAYDERLFGPQDKRACRTALGLPQEAPIIVYAGMTFAHRWLDGLLEAAKQLAPRYPGLTVVLVGGREQERAGLREAGGRKQEAGGERFELPASEQSERPASCLLIPPRPQEEVVRYLGAADVLAIPDTVTDVTASPLKLFEYLALGTPLVLPALPALFEIVPPTLAHAFPRRDLAGLTAALDSALAARNDTAAAEARRSIAVQHTYGHRAERIIDLVERVGSRRQ
jgi:glycosyltransferase involved in cell wall biosynthesis